MIRAFLAEWVKLGRPRFLGGVVAVMAGFAALSTVLLIAGVISGEDRGPIQGPGVVDLAAADGVAQGLALAASFLSVVALVIVAWKVAAEFGEGTIRNLVIRQPHRGRLAAGKVTALCSVLLIGVLAAAAVSVALSFALAPTNDVDTMAWTTSDGLVAVVSGVLNMSLAVLGWGLLGAALGLVVGSSAMAIGIGMAWMLPAENLLALAMGDIGNYLPGRILTTLADGGGDPGYVTALAVGVLYVAAASIIGTLVFARRDLGH